MKRTIKQTLFAWALLGFGLLATILTSQNVKNDIDQDALRQFSFTCDQITLKIHERLGAYALTLRGGAALFEASEDVTRKEWQGYTETLRVHESLPGVLGIGFSQVIMPDQLASHTARVRGEGFPDYRVHPPGQRDIYTSIVYLEPLSDRNLRALGFDMFSESVRRTAMEQARDTGKAALSGKVELVQETDVEVQAGTLMYMPVYRPGMPHNTVEQKRAALAGWVYSPYRMGDLMAGILGDWEHHEGQTISLEVYDGAQVVADNLLFASKTAMNGDKPPLLRQQRIIDFNGRQWLLEFDRIGRPFLIGYAPVWATLAGGLTLSGLLFGLIFSAINTEANASRIANRLTEEIRHRETLLTESEYRWRFALEGSGDGVWDWNLENRTVFFSKRWKEMLGFAEEEIGSSLDEWKNRIHPDDKADTVTAVKNYLNGKTSVYVHEHRVRCKGGNYKWVLDQGMVVSRDEAGNPLRMIGTHSDITDFKNLEETLRKHQQELQEAQRIAQIGNWQMDIATRNMKWSEELYRMLKLDPKIPLPPFSEQFRFYTPSSWERLNIAISKAINQGTPYELELEIIRADGSHGWMLAKGEAVRDATGKVISLRGVRADITERKQAELALRAAHLEAQRFRNALDYVSSYIYMKDTQGRYLYANRATLELFGVSAEELVGSDDYRFFPPDTAKLLRNVDARVFQGERTTEEIEVPYPEGGRRVFWEIKTPIYEDENNQTICGLLGISTNITSLKEHEQYLERIAHYDALTGLANRVLFADRLHQSMAQALRRGKQLAVAYIDLDGFKAINDNYGHDAGDHLLMAVAKNMKRTLREGDSLARLGGDEFVAMLQDLPTSENSTPMLTRLLTAASEPVTYQKKLLQVSASIGVTFFPQPEEMDADQLLRQADHAMYQAKLAGKNKFHIFDIEQDRVARGYHETLERVRQALAQREFVLYYQPKVNMRSGAIVGVEALVRWRHPDKGLLSPAIFLPIIEDHPLAVEFGEWVIDSALTQMEHWQADGLDIPISVNVGARQLHQDDFVERLKSFLAAHPKVNPASLELEVLETSALADLAQVCRVINECRAIGVNFALDDFGTGYSSLSYLKRLAVDTLKIDQSFVHDMLHNPEDLAILEGVLGLATAFRRRAIAEGVETVEHGEMLLQLGCDIAQGYGIAQPMPADQLNEWISTWKPYAGWTNQKALDRSNLPLLYAGVELRAWAYAFEALLVGKQTNSPPLDPHQCRFGIWLDAGGLADRCPQPVSQAIDTLHQRVHDLAAEFNHFMTEGRDQEVRERLNEFYGLRNRLLEHLKALQDNNER